MAADAADFESTWLTAYWDSRDGRWGSAELLVELEQWNQLFV
jgi:hypothetical protein